MTTIFLSPKEANAIGSFLSIADTKNSPDILKTVRLSANGTDLQIVATDRYLIAEANISLSLHAYDSQPLDEVQFLIPVNILKSLKASKATCSLEYDSEARSVTFEAQGAKTTAHSPHLYSYPKLDTMLPSTYQFEVRPTNEPIHLNMDLLNKVSKLQLPNDNKHTTNSYGFYAQGNTDSNSKKPKPVLLKRDNMLVLLQPVLGAK